MKSPTARRLTNFEYQNTMRDLLAFGTGIFIPLRARRRCLWRIFLFRC
ncbi:MAG: DUF1587 domain-containing protein [Verrucomicrobiales bacterium]